MRKDIIPSSDGRIQKNNSSQPNYAGSEVEGWIEALGLNPKLVQPASRPYRSHRQEIEPYEEYDVDAEVSDYNPDEIQVYQERPVRRVHSVQEDFDRSLDLIWVGMILFVLLCIGIMVLPAILKFLG